MYKGKGESTMTNSIIWVLVAFGAYMLMMIVIGARYAGQTKNSEDFFLGGRNLNGWVAALSAQASDMSGWLLMGLPGSVYAFGTGQAYTLPAEFQISIAWFLCASAILRKRGHKKPISMLVHTTSIQNGHFEEYDVLKSWLIRENQTGKILELCKTVYTRERNEFRLRDLKEGYPEYAALSAVNDHFPEFAARPYIVHRQHHNTCKQRHN